MRNNPNLGILIFFLCVFGEEGGKRRGAWHGMAGQDIGCVGRRVEAFF